MAHDGTGLVSLFGNFSGAFNVSGAFQSFGASPGAKFEMSAWARHWSGDALAGSGAPADNWVLAKIAFFDAGSNEVGAVETTILHGGYLPSVWHQGATLQATAPGGTASVQAQVLFLQPNGGGGAAHVDDVSFTASSPPQPTSGVPAVATMTRVAAGGQLEVREVRPDGSHGPWSRFEIRGIDVGWTPVGFYPWTATPPMLADPAFHDVLDELKAAGVNVLRFYFLPGSGEGLWGPETRDTLDLIWRMGMKVLWALDASLIGSPQALSELSASILGFGDHPATLGFAIGNEWNLNIGHGASIAKAADVQAIAAFLKTADPDHAVISSLVCGPQNDLFEEIGGTSAATGIVGAAPDVDLWGMNLYRAGSFHPFFYLWPLHTNGATYAIFEWGADSWNQVAFAVDYPQQATETAWHLDEAWRVTAGPAGQPAYAGTFVFAAVDEYWKNTNPGNSVWVQESSGFFTTPVLAPPSNGALALSFRADADGHRSEEHFGILELPNLAPKPVYATVADRFLNRTTPRPDVDLEVISVGWVGASGGLDNGYWGLAVGGNDAWHGAGGAGGRGLTLLTFDRSSGSVASKTTFDTYAAVDSGTSDIADAIAAIQAVPTGTLMGLAVADTLVHWNGNPAPYAGLVSTIQARTGSTTIGSVGFREGWALLGLAGAATPLAEATPAAGARVEASATVLLDLDGDGILDDVDLDLDGDGLTNSWETAQGTDPVRPAGQRLTLDVSLNAASVLSIAVLPGDAGGTLADIDLASLRLELASPAPADATALLFSSFTVTLTPGGGLTLDSAFPVPPIPGGRLVLRFLDTTGRSYSASLRID